jgi:hypothetical protein
MKPIIDIEAALVAFLKNDPDLEELHGGRVSTEVPADAEFPRIRITRTGGLTSVEGWLDRPRVTVEAWAKTKAEAWELASMTLAVLQARLPASPIPAGVITDVRPDIGIAWTPDPTTDLARYTFAVAMTTHPNP